MQSRAALPTHPRAEMVIARRLIVWTAIFACTSGRIVEARISARLRTRETAIELQAGAVAPRLLSLQSPGARWDNTVSEPLIDSVEMGGRQVALKWWLNRAASHVSSRRAVFVYDSDGPHLRLSWEWAARAPEGPLEHRIHIQNLGSREVWLPLQDSFRFAWRVAAKVSLEHVYIEKGADTPSPVGTHEVKVGEDYRWQGTSSTYARPLPHQRREIIPWFLVERSGRVKSGWYVGVEFSGCTRLSLKRDVDSLSGATGLNPSPGPFRTRLLPGESFETPVIFLGAFDGGVDAAGNVLRPWVRWVLNNPLTWKNPNYPLLVNNSWGSGMDINETRAENMMRDAAALGMEMFHLDAGWFRGPGDWYPNRQKFPHGLAALAERAHHLGLKFGLWVDWTQAGSDTAAGALNARDPKIRDWLVSDVSADWKPEPFKGQTIDIGDPAAKTWAWQELNRMVHDYHLDMLEHDGYLVAQGCVRSDHPHAPPDPRNLSLTRLGSSYFVENSNSTDVSYHAVEAYYDLYSRLRKSHPGLLLEACNDGGRMVDFGSAAHVDYFSITDTYDPLSNRRAFYDASHLLPPAMLESYVEKWPTATLNSFRYMLRSGMMGWLTIMQDTTKWTPQQHACASKELQLYKSELRPLIRDANLYHISERPDGVHWDGMEYFEPYRSRGVVYAFRGSTRAEAAHSFVLQGLKPGAKYRVHFHDQNSRDRICFGRELMSSGIRVPLAAPDSSELIFFNQVSRPSAKGNRECDFPAYKPR